MKTTINSKALASALSKLQPAIQVKAANPIMECVRVQALDKSTLILSTTNADMELSCVVEAETKKQGAFCVAFNRFNRAVSAMGGNIELKHEKDSVTLQCGKNRVTYSVLPDAQWLSLEIDADEYKEYEGITKAINHVQHAASEDDKRFVLQSVRFDDDVILSTEGHIISRHALGTGIKATVPISLVKAVMKGKPDSLSVAFSSQFVAFDSGDFRAKGKLIDASFPGWQGAVKPMEKKLEINRQEFISVIERGMLANEDRIKLVFSEKDKSIEASSESGPEAASCETSCNSAFDLTIKAKPSYLLQVLAAIDSEVVWIGSPEDESQILIESGESKHIILPINSK